jgi:hypothetical protein
VVSFHAPSTSHTVLDASSYRLDTAIRPDSGEPRYVVVDADGFLHPEATAWLQFLTDVGRSPNTVRDYGRRVAWRTGAGTGGALHRLADDSDLTPTAQCLLQRHPGQVHGA